MRASAIDDTHTAQLDPVEIMQGMEDNTGIAFFVRHDVDAIYQQAVVGFQVAGIKSKPIYVDQAQFDIVLPETID